MGNKPSGVSEKEEKKIRVEQPTTEEAAQFIRLPFDVRLWSYGTVKSWIRELNLSYWFGDVFARLEICGPKLIELSGLTTSLENPDYSPLKELFLKCHLGEPFHVDKAHVGISEIRFRPCPQIDLIDSHLSLMTTNLSQRLQKYSPNYPLQQSLPFEHQDISLRERIEGMIWLVYIGDAMGMPVQWFYHPKTDIPRMFDGWIDGYRDAPPKNPTNTIMHSFWENNREHCCETVGKHILHGKEKFWQEPYFHYHHGLQAGENTLNVLLFHELMSDTLESEGFDRERWIQRYIEFMTTPGRHKDPYAETFHLQYFYQNQCKPGKENHSMASIGAFVPLPFLITLAFDSFDEIDQPEVFQRACLICEEFLSITHTSPRLVVNARLFVFLVLQLLRGQPLNDVAQIIGKEYSIDFQGLLDLKIDDSEALSLFFGLACYIHDALPCALYLALKYQGDIEGAVMANTNCGGNTTHRGSILGAILGASFGSSAIPLKWKEGLLLSEPITHNLSGWLKKKNEKG